MSDELVGNSTSGQTNNCTVDLKRFAAAFPTEVELRAAILTLLTKMPGVSRVQETHGTLEHGKDIVFYNPGALGELQLNACVIKNCKISGNVDSNQGARTVFQQAEQALDTPHITASGSDESVAHVYIISPCECSQLALASIRGKLKHRSGQVSFACGISLLDLFERYWPEFLVFESDLLGAYIKSAQQELDTDSAVLNVLFRSGFLVEHANNTQSFYVPPRFRQHLCRFQLCLDLPEKQIRGLDRPLSKNRLLALQSRLRRLGTVATSLQLWTPLEIRKKQHLSLSEQVTRFAADLGDSWKQAHEVQLRALHSVSLASGEGQAPSVKIALANEAEAEALEVTVADSDLWIETGLSLMKELQRIEKALNERIALANSCRSEDVAILRSDSFFAFCSVQDSAASLGSALFVSEPTASLTFPESLLDGHHEPLLITGAPGFGKTTFCKANVSRDLAAIAKGLPSAIPVYIALHKLAQGPLPSFEECFIRSGELRDYLVEAKQQDSKRRLRLYLDGLDEVPTLQRQQDLVEMIYNATKRYENLQVIITGRDYVGGPWLNWLPRVFLAPLSESQIRSLVSKWLENSEKDVELFFAHLSLVPALKPLMAVPLLATLILAVYRKTRGKLPENKIKLYEMFVELLSGGWDAAKNLNRDSRFGSGTKLTILTRIAGRLHHARVRECEELEIGIAIREVLPGLADQKQQLIGELLQDGILSRTSTKFTFSHHSFQESLAARDLASRGEHVARAILREYLTGDDWWAEAIRFYMGRSSNPPLMASWIKEVVSTLWEDSDDDSPKERGAELIEALEQFFPGFADSTTSRKRR